MNGHLKRASASGYSPARRVRNSMAQPTGFYTYWVVLHSRLAPTSYGSSTSLPCRPAAPLEAAALLDSRRKSEIVHIPGKARAPTLTVAWTAPRGTSGHRRLRLHLDRGGCARAARWRYGSYASVDPRYVSAINASEAHEGSAQVKRIITTVVAAAMLAHSAGHAIADTTPSAEAPYHLSAH